jgi:hypothetical protein
MLHTELLLLTRSMRYGVEICCAIQIADTLNSIDLRFGAYTKSHLRFGAKKKIGSDSCLTPNRRYTKSHLRFAANRTHLIARVTSPFGRQKLCLLENQNCLQLKIVYVRVIAKSDSYFGLRNVGAVFKCTYIFLPPYFTVIKGSQQLTSGFSCANIGMASAQLGGQ